MNKEVNEKLTKLARWLADSVGFIFFVIVVWLLVRIATTHSKGIDAVESVLKNLGWSQTLILFGIIFMIPVYRLLTNLASRLSSASKIKIGDVEIHRETLADIIIEREKLRTGIYMASVDGISKETEFKYLRTIELEMPNRLEELTKDGRFTVLQTAIQMSIVDFDLDQREYNALKNLGAKFDISKDDLDVKIINAVIEKYLEGVRSIKLPQELDTLLAQVKIRRQIS